MSDVTPPTAGISTAGAMLRAARQARGMELDTLSQVLKVPERKLAALEADRYTELPGMAFARSLAQSYARQVGLDAAVVLAQLPGAGPQPQQRLESVSRGLQTPYREGASGATFGRSSGSAWPEWLKPVFLLPAVLLLAALAFWFAPPMHTMFGGLGWPDAEAGSDATAMVVESAPVPVAASAAGVVVGVPVAVVAEPPVAPASAVAPTIAAVSETVHSTPSEPAASAASAPSAASGVVVLRTTGESWIEVRDAAGAVLLSRTVLPGEVIGLDGALPMRLKAGIANVTQVTLRGEPFSLAPFTRGNVATAILK
jgi:cytoskeleton protein RodZ